MPRYLRVALAQINPAVGDLELNSRKIREKAEEAEGQGADIITFPELSICGYPPEDLLLKEGFVRDCMEALEKLARQSGSKIVIAVGCVSGVAPGSIYNSCALLHGGEIRAVYRKTELPNYGVFDEQRYFAKGEDPLVFSINGIPSGINICEDVWKTGTAEAQAQAGASVIFNISASPFHLGKPETRKDLVSGKAAALKIPFCYNNMVGAQDELVFDGGSFIADGSGNISAEAGQFAETLLLADVKAGEGNGPHGNMISFSTGAAGKKNLKRPEKAPSMSETARVYSALVLGTGDYAKKNRFGKAVLGISGGIDSALTAAVAADALGRENVLGVLMPSRFTTRETVEDSKKLAELTGIKLIEIPIDSMFEEYLLKLGPEFSSEGGAAEENLQARIRGTVLMALSNKHGHLVLTTGNKSELSCGYCTLYGDMAGGFSVLKDVYKTTVYRLARFRNSSGRAIPESIITKEPTAELKHSQKDTDTLPPYELLDEILVEYIEKGRNFSQLLQSGRYDAGILRKVVSMVDSSEYKRRQSPPGVKITPCAFGRDRRMPITNRYRQ